MDFGDYIAQNREKKRQEGMEATSLRKLMSIYDPEGKDQYTSMGLGELRGSAQAIAVKQHLEQLQREEEARTAERNFYDVLGNVPGGVGPAAPLTGERMLSAAAQSNYRLPPQVLTQMMKESEGVNWTDVMPRPFEIDGVKGAVGKSGQFQFLPPQTGDSMQAVPVLDDQGNVLGFRVPNGKGGSAPVPKNSPKTLPDSYNSRISTLLDDITTKESALAKSDEELAQLYRVKNGAEQRKALANQMTASRKALADHVARFKGQGYADNEFWKAEEERLGLATPPAPAKAKAGNYPRATNPKTGVTLIYKDDKWQKE